MPFCYCPRSLFHKWFPLGVEPQEKKHEKQPQEDKRKKENLRERFVKDKRPLNPTHIFPRQEKQPKTRTTKRAILMSQFDDDEAKEILQKKQRRQEDTIMRGNIHPQQQQQHQRSKEKSISPQYDSRPQIFPKQKQRLNG